jgi:hypothetical protein
LPVKYPWKKKLVIYKLVPDFPDKKNALLEGAISVGDTVSIVAAINNGATAVIRGLLLLTCKKNSANRSDIFKKFFPYLEEIPPEMCSYLATKNNMELINFLTQVPGGKFCWKEGFYGACMGGHPELVKLCAEKGNLSTVFGKKDWKKALNKVCKNYKCNKNETKKRLEIIDFIFENFNFLVPPSSVLMEMGMEEIICTASWAGSLPLLKRIIEKSKVEIEKSYLVLWISFACKGFSQNCLEFLAHLGPVGHKKCTRCGLTVAEHLV